MPTPARRNEQVPEGSFQKGVESVQWDYLPAQAGFPFPEGDSSGQFQRRGSAERLAKPNLKTAGNRRTSQSGMMMANGLEFSGAKNLTLLEHSPDKVGLSDLRRAHPARPAALGHLSLCSFAVAPPPPQLLLLQLKTVSKCSLKGILWERFLYLSFWEAGKKYLTPL